MIQTSNFLESRMLRNWHVRFGGGQLEKCRKVTRWLPTLLGVDASTVCRWLAPFASLGWMWLQHQCVSFSGQVAVDEKESKIGGVTWNLCVAVDCVTRCPLHVDISPSKSEWYCRTFLLELNANGYRPSVIVTDG